MIEFARRGNMKYFIFLFFFHYIRRIESILISKILNFNSTVVFTFLMYIGEFLGGIAVIIYQKYLLKKSKEKQNNILLIKITKDRQEKYRKNKRDKLFIIIILIFFASFFDFAQFVILYNLPKLSALSPTSDQRLSVIITITSALLCTYGLKFKMGKHHIFSLIGMAICSLIVLIVELIFKLKDTEFGSFIFSFFLIICSLAFVGYIDVIERYLVEFDFVDKYKILSSEGFIGIIISIIFLTAYKKEPISILNKAFKEFDLGESILMIFFLILYFFLSAGINIYKIICNVVYTPMSKSLPAYFLNPLFNVIYFIWENDFISEGEKNYFYFIMNVILSIIIDFFSLIYNEFIILKCFGLEFETHHEISKRTLVEMEQFLEENSRESDINGYYVDYSE